MGTKENKDPKDQKDVKEEGQNKDDKGSKDPKGRGQKGSDKRRKQRKKQNKQNQNPKENKENKEDKEPRKSKNNDASWYSQNEQVLKDAASISMYTPSGVIREFGFADPLQSGVEKYGIAGVWSLRYWPTCGQSKGSNSAVNFAAKKLYTYVRHANSGHTNYDSPDLMEYVLAKSSLDATIAWLQRAYGVVMKYSSLNRYLPQALFASMNIDYNDIMDHIADFRLFINLMATRLNALPIPFDFPIYKRWIWMNGNLFTDRSIDKAQIYIFNPMSVLTYNPTGDNIGNLTHTKLQENGGAMTFTDIKNIVSDLVNKFVTDEDCNIMGGDILKAYGANKIAQLPMIDENYSVGTYYSEEVLSQIHNAYAFQHIDGNGPDIIQDSDGVLTCEYQFVQEGAPLDYIIVNDDMTDSMFYQQKVYSYNEVLDDTKVLYDIYKNDPTPSDHIVATRLTYVPKEGAEINDDDEIVNELASFGTEVVDTFKVYTIAKLTTGYSLRNITFTSFIVVDSNNASADALDNISITLTQFPKFDYHPRIRVFIFKADNNDKEEETWVYRKFFGDVFDTDNYTVIDDNELEKMHLCAVSSELDLTVKEFNK